MLTGQVLHEEPAKRKRGRPAKSVKQLSQISTVNSFSQFENSREPSLVQKEAKKQVQKRLKGKGFVDQQSQNAYPYLKDILKATQFQDYNYITQAQFSKEEPEWAQRIGFKVILDLVEKFHLQQSTGIIAYYMVGKFFSYHLEKDSGKTAKHLKSGKNLSTAEQNSASSSSRMDEKDVFLYSKTALFVAAKFNEVHWPSLNSVFESISLKQFHLMEYELLRPLDFKVPNPNHCFYLELLFSLFNVSKESETKIRERLTLVVGKLNFFALCPKIVAIFLFSEICEKDASFE